MERSTSMEVVPYLSSCYRQPPISYIEKKKAWIRSRSSNYRTKPAIEINKDYASSSSTSSTFTFREGRSSTSTTPGAASSISSMSAPPPFVLGDADFLSPFSAFSPFLFLLFFFGKSHSHSGINDSTYIIHQYRSNPNKRDSSHSRIPHPQTTLGKSKSQDWPRQP